MRVHCPCAGKVAYLENEKGGPTTPCKICMPQFTQVCPPKVTFQYELINFYINIF